MEHGLLLGCCLFASCAIERRYVSCILVRILLEKHENDTSDLARCLLRDVDNVLIFFHCLIGVWFVKVSLFFIVLVQFQKTPEYHTDSHWPIWDCLALHQNRFGDYLTSSTLRMPFLIMVNRLIVCLLLGSNELLRSIKQESGRSWSEDRASSVSSDSVVRYNSLSSCQIIHDFRICSYRQSQKTSLE